MSVIMELLYNAWIGQPDPSLWPDYLRDDPARGHGFVCFEQGLRLGLLLAAEVFRPETGA